MDQLSLILIKTYLHYGSFSSIKTETTELMYHGFSPIISFFKDHKFKLFT